MSTHSVEQHLGMRVEDYDREIRRLVPHYDELVSEGMALLGALTVPDARILDVGSGTGRFAAAILAGMPRARVVLLDLDPEMLDHARARLVAHGDRASFVHGSFLDPLPACDAVVASLSLHHVKDLATKERAYRAIHDALPPGAPFLSLDASVPSDPALHELAMARWAEHMGAHGIDEPTARRHFSEWAREERYFSVPEELSALARAGFASPECFWRKGPLAILGACRA
jgi:tRNA (cmo5U34)-methyltransferase